MSTTDSEAMDLLHTKSPHDGRDNRKLFLPRDQCWVEVHNEMSFRLVAADPMQYISHFPPPTTPEKVPREEGISHAGHVASISRLFH